MTATTDGEPASPETQSDRIEARLTNARHELVRLSRHDSRRIAEALLDPPEPTPALMDAVRRYRELVSG